MKLFEINGNIISNIYILHIFFEGGNKMILVNIIFLVFMVAFCITTMSILVSERKRKTKERIKELKRGIEKDVKEDK